MRPLARTDNPALTPLRMGSVLPPAVEPPSAEDAPAPPRANGCVAARRASFPPPRAAVFPISIRSMKRQRWLPHSSHCYCCVNKAQLSWVSGLGVLGLPWRCARRLCRSSRWASHAAASTCICLQTCRLRVLSRGPGCPHHSTCEAGSLRVLLQSHPGRSEAAARSLGQYARSVRTHLCVFSYCCGFLLRYRPVPAADMLSCKRKCSLRARGVPYVM
jgi:hypothetical protein